MRSSENFTSTPSGEKERLQGSELLDLKFTSSLLQQCPSASATLRRISATSVRRAGSWGSLFAHDLTPAPGPVMRNDGPNHSDERLLVDRLPR
jgi:hypothetical protein